MIVYTGRSENLTLSDKAMSSGAEGEIHSVVSKPTRFGDICVKIYFKHKRNSQLEKKIKYMVANPPNQIYSNNNLIGWPLEVVYDGQRNFIGFIMPLAFSNSEKLIELTAKKLSKKLDPIWAEKFDRRLGASSMISRLKLICNIAIPIHILHATGKYVFRDFKPDNVLVTNNGSITLVDMDSIQICENGRLLFPAGTLGTPGYMPPEHYSKNIGSNINLAIEKSWDYFSVGVVFYQIIFGLHPYVVTPLISRDSNSNEIYQNIADNLFPFGPNATKISNYPPPHNNFRHIPNELQQLFKNSFSSNASARPTLESWIRTVKDVIRKAPKPPVPMLGTISVQYSPSSARVSMDNIYIGMTPISFKVPVGIHSVNVSGPEGERTYSIEVKKDETTNVNTNLSNIGSSGNDSANNSGTSDNSGCIWTIVIGLILGVIILIAANANNGNNYSQVETVDTDSIAEVIDSVAFEDSYESNNATFLSVSDDDLYFDAEGGNQSIAIETDGEWEISVSTADWGHLTRQGNVLNLSVDEHTELTKRTDYFVVKAGEYERRIEITQNPNNSPTAEIERIWMDHNVYQNGEKGMKIHVHFTNKNMKDKRIYVYAYFYQEDNTTQLHDQYGNALCTYASSTPQYDSSTYEDFDLFISHSDLNMAPGTNGTFSFDISIKNSEGNELARENNTQFTFSNI